MILFGEMEFGTNFFSSGITGKCFIFIKNMYADIKSKTTVNAMSSTFFNCNAGVRRGENLSPFLFSLYINELEK